VRIGTDNGEGNRRSPAGMTTRKAEAKAETKYRGPSPFDYAQGQDDDVKTTAFGIPQPREVYFDDGERPSNNSNA